MEHLNRHCTNNTESSGSQQTDVEHVLFIRNLDSLDAHYQVKKLIKIDLKKEIAWQGCQDMSLYSKVDHGEDLLT